MSVKRLTQAWETPLPKKHTQKLVLLALADNAQDDTGLAWPSLQTIATKCGLTPAGVRKQIRALVEAGLLAVIENGGGHRNNKYQVFPPLNTVYPSTPFTPQHRLPQGVTPFTPGVNSVYPPLKPSVNHQKTSTPNPHQDSDKATHKKAEAIEALSWLNELAGSSFRTNETNLTLIEARMEEEGVDLAGVKEMIQSKVNDWKDNPDMAKYLRPSTLFRKSKFTDYYDQRKVLLNQQNRPEPTGCNGNFI